MLGRLPARFHRLAPAIDGCTDSGLESIVRLWLLDEGIPFDLHALVHGLEVDFRIGSLVIETDGREVHAGADAFENDRNRDLILGAHGFVVLRFSYRQIMYDWERCVARIRRHLAHGDHRRPTT